MSNRNSTILDVFEEQINALTPQLNGAANSAGYQARKLAFDTFKEHGFPTRKNEEYRYTPLGKALEESFADFTTNPAIDYSKIKEKELPVFSGNTIVFINGTYDETMSQLTEKNNLEIIISKSQKDLIENASLASGEEDAFSGLNLALATSGCQINVEKGAVIEESINIIHITCAADGKVMANCRHEVNIGENAQAKITEIFLGSGDQAAFTNSVMEVSLAHHAILEHYKVGLDSDHELRIDNTRIQQQNNSVLHTVNVNFGGKMIRNNLNITLNGEHCETNLDGLYMPVAKGTIDNHTVVDHRLPNSNSNELYKGIIGKQATGVFNGKVFVRQDAQKTNAFQSNNNILLADTATINTKPQLEIWADDVKCTHGCTTGQMDKEQLFYLRARGIDKESAQKLLLKAFAEEVIEKIKDEVLRARVAAILEEKLDS